MCIRDRNKQAASFGHHQLVRLSCRVVDQGRLAAGKHQLTIVVGNLVVVVGILVDFEEKNSLF